jgi:polysaccharide deacetylase family protein (PEP-CTERM system associated)
MTFYPRIHLTPCISFCRNRIGWDQGSNRRPHKVAFEVRTARAQLTCCESRPNPEYMPSNTTSHFFTVDVEEYFQVRALESVVSREDWTSRPSRISASLDLLLEMLARHNARGTFFVLGWIAKHRPEVVRAIAAAGHEIASHGYWHERVTVHTPDSFRADVRASKRVLEDVSGCEILGYRAPNFSIVPGFEWAFDVLMEEGYKYDSSLFPIRRRGYGYPGAPSSPHIIQRPSGSLAEFPLATTSLFRYPVPAAGGGYLRHFPLAVIRRAFREANSRGEPGTFYIHPWEIDPGQPRLPVSVLTRIRHYRGLGSALSRLELILKEFAFTTIASYLPELAKRKAPAVVVGAA